MRWIFVLFLLFISGTARASENLIENIGSYSNTIINDGIVYQDYAMPMGSWKCQARYANNKHISVGSYTYELIFYFSNTHTGFISYTFTTPDDLEDLVFFVFGFNGSEKDTLINFDIKDVMPNTTYTLQWRVLNSTQGEIAWTDMFLTRCGDGYSLSLGDENCSRVCESQSVAGGHVPPDATKVYEPETCSYDTSKLVCDDGYFRIDNTCEQMCTAGITHLYIGGNKNGLYARRIGTPALYIKYNGNICYGHLSPGVGTGLNIRFNGTIYHLID